MKLIIQIPCLNEEETLPAVLRDLPTTIPGIDIIETQIIDDGSTDHTVAVAQELGVTYIVRNKTNKGLARSFQKGIEHALLRGADIIVNTDGDNQYDGNSIPDLVKPIVEDRADIVLGDRDTASNMEFSALKRRLQAVGSSVVQRMAGIEVTDAVSGFRAYSREAAFSINVMTTFSYTTETLIHAGQMGLTIVSVPVGTNSKTRPSRLFSSMSSFIKKQALTILRSYVMYRSLNAFSTLGAVMIVIGIVPIIRFLYFYFIGEGGGNIQSLILGSMFLLAGYLTLVLALLSDTIATNRRLIEATLRRVRHLEIDQQMALSDAAEPPFVEAPQKKTASAGRK
ncbi:glycosyltransferase family 2 protein [uncultured Roseobacter sp.]|uniref:glycosyltransferase family 2 protein n=1 Tax=uncultured Roseobacter sp. TaxID=114847 RepID=UPI0026331ED2|nr:glycosyltransferase family 2 protein [uncultured Roseobacter sp.]